LTVDAATSATANFSTNPVAPSITTNPSNQTVNAGSLVTFTAAATGNPTPTYQWQVSINGGSSFSNISGATNASYTISSTTSSENGYEYQCVASNGVSPAATTTAATLTVDYAPAITTQPTGQSVNSGSGVTFTAAATGNPTPTYQWQVSTNGGSNFSNIGGATNATYSITSTTSSQNGNEYRCVASNGVSPAATTNAAILIVDYAPTISISPSSPSVNTGSSVTFTAVAAGNPVPTYQWQISTNNGGSFSNIAGATSSAYTFSPTYANNGYQYKCLASNTVQSNVSSNAATLTVFINGACGAADQTYAYGTSSFGSNSLCLAGNSSPSSVAFPGAGATVSWTCQGVNGGSPASCSAKQNPKQAAAFRF